MALRVGAVVLRVRDLDRMAGFWASALDAEPRAEPEETWVSLRPRSGRGPNLSLDVKPSEYDLPPRLHLDLYADDQRAEVERLAALGATEVPLDHHEEVDWVLMEDPEGNRFCVVQLPEDGRGAF